MRRHRRISYLLLFLCAYGAEKKIPSVPLQPPSQRPFMLQGEKLKFKVTYLGITGGYADMICEIPQEDPKNMRLILRAATTPAVSKFYNMSMSLVSYSDKETLHNLFYDEDRMEQKRVYEHKLDFTNTPGKIMYVKGRMGTAKTNFLDTSEPGFNVLSSFHISRTQKLISGTSFPIRVFYNSKVYVTKVTVVERDVLNTAFGKIKAVLVIPKMDFKGLIFNTGDLKIWLSDDEWRVPVLLESEVAVGSFKGKLIEGWPGASGK